MSAQAQEKEETHEIKVFSARKALVDLKAKLSVSSTMRIDTTLTHTESRMILALLDDRTPWTL